MATSEPNRLGDYLRARRSRLDPIALGLPASRRRTPGLRREEVAQRANISPTWYTWIEQGRGGNASADVLDRISRALMLTEVEREHIYLLGLGRPPEVRYRGSEGISPRLQGVLDAMVYTPATVRTATWDIVGWNRAAAIILGDYGARPPGRRNVLRMIFCDPAVRAAQYDWDSVARTLVASLRVDAARAGADAEVAPLVEELCRASAEFAAMWRDNDIAGHAHGFKRLRHPVLGVLEMDISSFAVEGRPDLSMVVYAPNTPEGIAAVRALIERSDDGPAGSDQRSGTV
ncbi:helix-turn-helix transcriptional regulator [Sphingomonas nostoxanthinifaciens]|uniref:helix-turn-helix transcriptional regulator n=1 Tax=Sphingomonas nostoxanthinifaciens TaxID=2872652 RepID=UPI001CC1C4EA|nr:helix-turn-helix transcriptional regulator [Sphingomonas nostoxanthinifaciens]UAK26264.1 helix-turn-helix transcriptional regulator [Sphingomonas nostoxanthinifaciens]